jgi:hypothetical protein
MDLNGKARAWRRDEYQRSAMVKQGMELQSHGKETIRLDTTRK